MCRNCLSAKSARARATETEELGTITPSSGTASRNAVLARPVASLGRPMYLIFLNPFLKLLPSRLPDGFLVEAQRVEASRPTGLGSVIG